MVVDPSPKLDNKPHHKSSPEQREALSQETKKALNTDFETLEKATTTTQTKENSRTLAYQIETQKYEQLPLTTYTEIIAGTPLQSKILKVFSHPDFDNYPQLQSKTPEQRAEYLFRKINTALSRFYAKRLAIAPDQPIPTYLSQVLVPATERFLMDILRANQHTNNVNFLASMTELKLESITELFQGVTAFSKKFTYPYQQAQKLMRIVDFISLPARRPQLSKLTNPYEFYDKLIQHPIWEKEIKNPDQISRTQFKLTDLTQPLAPEEQQQLLLAWQQKIQKELWSIQMVDSPATVKKLLDVVKKSESFFVKSDQISSAMMDKMDALQGVDSTMRSVFGINVFEEIQSSKFLSGVLNFVLNLLGFSGGVVGLERDWRRRTLDRALTAPKKAFIQASYQYYIQHKSSTENFSQKVIDDYHLQLPDEKQKQLFDLDVPLLQKTLLNNLDPKTLNPNLLAALNTKTFSGKDYLLDTKKDQNQTTAIKPELFENEELKKELINAYLSQTLPHLSQNPSFLQKAQDANTIAFTLIAGLSVDQEHLIEGIKVSALLPQEFYQPLPATTETQQEENPSDQEQVQRIKNLTFADKISDTARAVIQSELERTTPKSPLTLEMILHSAQKYQIPIEYLMAVVKNDSSYGTQWRAVRTMNPGNVGNTDDGSERKFKSWQEGLDAAAEVIKQRVDAYQALHGRDHYPWIQNLMENRDQEGKGFLAHQANYKQLNEYRGDQAPLGAYMTAGTWPQKVAQYTEQLSDKILQA